MILYRSDMEQIDLQGEDRIGAKIKIEAFLNDNYKLKNKEIAIICGVGKGILKKEALAILRRDKRVEEYNIDMFNEGCILVKLKENLTKSVKSVKI